MRLLIFDHINLQTCLSPDKIFFNECDAVLSASLHSYEDASLIEMKSWYKSLPQGPLPIYAIGPLLRPGYGRHPVESSESGKGKVERDIEVFLKEMQSKHGERSVVFVGLLPYYCIEHLGYCDFRSLLGRFIGLWYLSTSMRSYKR